MNLRQLLNWGLIHRVHRRGDRKEYFVAEGDIWQMFEIITRERRRREVEPIVETIEKCRSMIEGELDDKDEETQADIREYDRRLKDMQEFFTTMNTLFNLLIKAGKGGVGTFITSIGRLARG
jgi:DNA-binding transcriptional regulator GbsR (MarR family)